MKSYTDIEQSKVLAEILLLESADMCWSPFDEKYDAYLGAPNPNAIKKEIPCWSLAALINIIQKTTPYKMEHFNDKKVQLTCVLGDKPWELIISDFDNEVDACYEMILKLHELKML